MLKKYGAIYIIAIIRSGNVVRKSCKGTLIKYAILSNTIKSNGGGYENKILNNNNNIASNLA